MKKMEYKYIFEADNREGMLAAALVQLNIDHIIYCV